MKEKNKLFSLTGVKRSFLGIQSSFDDADICITPVHYDATTSYGSGTRFGPNAIIDASTQLELYDLELKSNICDKLSIYTLDELALHKGDPSKMLENVSQVVGCIVNLGKKPVIFGGEHSISAGAVKGFKKHYDLSSISVLQIDAHADLRDSYEGTKYSHASVMRRIREQVGNAVQVGIRSMCDEEAEYIKKEKIGKSIFYGQDVDKKQVLSQLKNDVYITIDVDGFDPSIFPGTGTPEPGGLSWNTGLSLLKEVAKKKNIIGFDLMETSPIPGSHVTEFATAKLAYKLMGYSWLK